MSDPGYLGNSPYPSSVIYMFTVIFRVKFDPNRSFVVSLDKNEFSFADFRRVRSFASAKSFGNFPSTCWVQIPDTGHVSLNSDADVLATDVGLKISNTELVHGRHAGPSGGSSVCLKKAMEELATEKSCCKERSASGDLQASPEEREIPFAGSSRGGALLWLD